MSATVDLSSGETLHKGKVSTPQNVSSEKLECNADNADKKAKAKEGNTIKRSAFNCCSTQSADSDANRTGLISCLFCKNEFECSEIKASVLAYYICDDCFENEKECTRELEAFVTMGRKKLLSTLCVCSTDSADDKRIFHDSSQNKADSDMDTLRTLQNCWQELRHDIRIMFRDGLGKNMMSLKGRKFDCEKIKRNVKTLFEKDPYQLYKRLESIGYEYVMNLKSDNLWQILVAPQVVPELIALFELGANAEKMEIERAKLFLKSLLDRFSVQQESVRNMSSLLSILDNEYLALFGVNWKIVNHYIFDCVIYQDDLLVNYLPCIEKVLRCDLIISDETEEEFISRTRLECARKDIPAGSLELVQSFRVFHKLMVTSREIFKKTNVNLMLYAEKQLLQDKNARKGILQDVEFFRVQRAMIRRCTRNDSESCDSDDEPEVFLKRISKLIEEGPATSLCIDHNGEAAPTLKCKECSMRHCSCDECRISHVITCGLLVKEDFGSNLLWSKSIEMLESIEFDESKDIDVFSDANHAYSSKENLTLETCSAERESSSFLTAKALFTLHDQYSRKEIAWGDWQVPYKFCRTVCCKNHCLDEEKKLNESLTDQNAIDFVDSETFETVLRDAADRICQDLREKIMENIDIDRMRRTFLTADKSESVSSKKESIDSLADIGEETNQSAEANVVKSEYRSKQAKRMKRNEKSSIQHIEEGGKEICNDLDNSLNDSSLVETKTEEEKMKKALKREKNEDAKKRENCCAEWFESLDKNIDERRSSCSNINFSGTAKDWLIQEIKNLNNKAIEKMSEQFAKKYEGEKFSVDKDFKIRFLECMSEISKGWRGSEEFDKIYEAMIATVKESNQVSEGSESFVEYLFKPEFGDFETTCKTSKYMRRSDAPPKVNAKRRGQHPDKDAFPFSKDEDYIMRIVHGQDSKSEDEYSDSTDEHCTHCDPRADHPRWRHSCDNKNRTTRDSPNSRQSQDGRHHCDCCYCEMFGHSMSESSKANRMPLIRERLRLKLKKRGENEEKTLENEDVKQGFHCFPYKEKEKSVADAPIEQILDFINAKDNALAMCKRQTAANRAAKRARQRQRKQEEKVRRETINKLKEEEERKAEEERRKVKEAEELKKKEEQQTMREAERRKKFEEQKRKAIEDRTRNSKKQKDQGRHQQRKEHEQSKTKVSNSNCLEKHARNCKEKTNSSCERKSQYSAKFPEKEKINAKENLSPVDRAVSEKPNCLPKLERADLKSRLNSSRDSLESKYFDNISRTTNSHQVHLKEKAVGIEMAPPVYQHHLDAHLAASNNFHSTAQEIQFPLHNSSSCVTQNPVRMANHFVMPPVVASSFVNQSDLVRTPISTHYPLSNDLLHVYQHNRHVHPNMSGKFSSASSSSVSTENWISGGGGTNPYRGMGLRYIEENLSNLNLSPSVYTENGGLLHSFPEKSLHSTRFSNSLNDECNMQGQQRQNEYFTLQHEAYQMNDCSGGIMTQGSHCAALYAPNNSFSQSFQGVNAIKKFDNDLFPSTTIGSHTNPVVDSFAENIFEESIANPFIDKREMFSGEDRAPHGINFDYCRELNDGKSLTEWSTQVLETDETNGDQLGSTDIRMRDRQQTTISPQDPSSIYHLTYDLNPTINEHSFFDRRNCWTPKPIPPEEASLSWELNLNNIMNNNRKLQPLLEEAVLVNHHITESEQEKRLTWEAENLDDCHPPLKESLAAIEPENDANVVFRFKPLA